MSDIRVNGIGAGSPLVGRAARKEDASGAFGAAMKEALGKVNEIQGEAEKAIQELASGGDITSAVLAMEKADLSFQIMVEVRNKLVSAYEEIMRMQV
ncbi:MAG: flagellar hook-basal body complex protein FliE [Thermodesulfovibrionales bacterium]